MRVYTEIKNLIGKGKLEEALEASLRLNDLDERTNNQLLILSGQYCKWKANNRIGIVDDSNINKIKLALLELIDEIKSSKSDSSSVDEKESIQQESEQITEMDKIDFNVPDDESVEVTFHYRHKRIKEKIPIPKDLTIEELIDTLVIGYNLEKHLPSRYHKVEWTLLLNHRKFTDKNRKIKRTLEKIGIKNGDNVSVKAAVTKYKIKMKDDKPEIEEKKSVINCNQ